MSFRNRICIITAIVIFLPLTAWADLSLPVANGIVTSGVGWRVDPFGSGKLVFHRGIDIAVPTGTPVHATRGGRVVFAGIHGGHGATVIVEHENGDRTLYGHNSTLTVHPREQVDAGAVIALSGNSGRSTGPHIHYEVLPSGRSFEIAEVAETIEQRTISNGGDLRQQQEQRIDEAVSSILRKIKGFSTSPGNVGQGG